MQPSGVLRRDRVRDVRLDMPPAGPESSWYSKGLTGDFNASAGSCGARIPWVREYGHGAGHIALHGFTRPASELNAVGTDSSVAITVINETPRFIARCPKCGELRRQGFAPDEVEPLLKERVLQFYCVGCDLHWVPGESGIANLRRWLRDELPSSARPVSPPPSAHGHAAEFSQPRARSDVVAQSPSAPLACPSCQSSGVIVVNTSAAVFTYRCEACHAVFGLPAPTG